MTSTDYTPLAPGRFPRRVSNGGPAHIAAPRASRPAWGSRRTSGRALVLFSSLCFAGVTILAQLAYRAGVPAATLTAARFVLAAAVFCPLAVGLGRQLPRRRDVVVALAVGLVYSAASELLFESLTQTKAAFADLLFFSYPALVVVAASLSGRESWNRRRASSVCISLAGTALVLGGGLNGLQAPGAYLALGAAALYAVYVLLASDLLARVDTLVLVGLVSAGAAVGATSSGLAMGRLQVPHGVESMALIGAFAFVSAVLGIGSFVLGVARLGPSRASIVSSAEPPLTALLAFLSFGDRLGPFQLIGGTLVLAAIVILERPLRRHLPAPSPRAQPKPGHPDRTTNVNAPDRGGTRCTRHAATRSTSKSGTLVASGDAAARA